MTWGVKMRLLIDLIYSGFKLGSYCVCAKFTPLWIKEVHLSSQFRL